MSVARRWVLLLVLLAAVGCRAADAPLLTVACDRADAVYAVGEPVRFTVGLTRDKQPVTAGSLRWQFTADGVGDHGKGQQPLTGQPVVLTGQLDQPGILRVQVTYEHDGARVVGLAGAAVAPDQIAPTERPDDFVAWWESQKALLAATPAEVVLRDDAARSTATVKVSELTINVLDGGRIRGWFCRPVAAGRYPAIVITPGAGVGPTGPQLGYAAQGYLSVNISVHDHPPAESREYFAALNEGELKDYRRAGLAARETYYFRRVWLGLVRCIDLLTAQPEWDQRNLVAYGSSQGGGSSLAIAGLDQRVTCAIANVPALCLHTGVLEGRASGWPRLIANANAPANEIATARYYDAANFAQSIRCPTLVTAGLIDGTCPATSVLAAYNGITAAGRELVIYPAMGHAMPDDWSQQVQRFLRLHVK